LFTGAPIALANGLRLAYVVRRNIPSAAVSP